MTFKNPKGKQAGCLFYHIGSTGFQPVHLIAFALAFLASSTLAEAGAKLDGDWIVVEGKDNTLQSVAGDINDEDILQFDEETGYGLAARSIRILGDLTIGGPETTGSIFRHVASLEFDIGQVGQARIQLGPPASGGPAPRLVVENARLATLHTDKGNDACNAEGNLIDVNGGLLSLQSSTITGNFVVRLNGGILEAADTIISTSNHAGLSVAKIAASKSALTDFRSLDHKLYGIEVGPIEGALQLADCTIRGGGADLHVRGRTELVARDCDFDSVRFAGQGGSVKRQWTVTVHTGTPGARVVAESESGAGLPEKVEATADDKGVARIVLTEFTAKSDGADYLRPGKNDSTPHRLTVYAPDGDKVLGTIRSYRVLTRGQEVRLP